MGADGSKEKYDEPVCDELLEATDAASVGYVMTSVRGIPQNPLFNVEMFESMIDTFETRDKDVFVCTYVKAGTTWAQQIVTLLCNGGEQGDKSYGEQVPWLEALAAPETLAEREAPGYTLEKINAMADPRFFKSHATVSDLPRGKAPGVKVIAIARNPKDTVVSLFHHASSKPERAAGVPCFFFLMRVLFTRGLRRFGYKGDFTTFLKVFLSGNAENGSWFKHVVEWHAASVQDPDHVLWLTYEQMIEDHAGSVAKIAAFLGLPDAGDVVAKTVANSTMKSMQANKKANIGMNHLRKGGVGGWRDYFTVTQSNLFDAVYAQKMAGTGLAFNFGEGLTM